MKYIIITSNGNEHWIDGETEKQLRNLSLNGYLKLPSGSLINGSSIMEILTENDYDGKKKDAPMKFIDGISEAELNQYPSWPTGEETKDRLYLQSGDTESKKMTPEQIKTKNIRRLESMLRGINKYISGPNYQGTDGPHNIRKMTLDKLEYYKNTPAEKQAEFTDPRFVYKALSV